MLAELAHEELAELTDTLWRGWDRAYKVYGYNDDVDPADFGAKRGTPAWDTIEAAANVFDKAIGARDDKTSIDAALPVVHAVLAAKR